MQLKLWGTRGSNPHVMSHEDVIVTLERLAKRAAGLGVSDVQDFLAAAKAGDLGTPLSFGGHTPCSEIIHDGDHYLIDLGTGVRNASSAYLGKTKTFNVFMTHYHWDHLMGFPFFVPVFLPGHTINIFHVHKGAEEYIRTLFNGTHFPVKWEDLQADIKFHQLKLYEPTEFGDLRVTSYALDHPGGSFGYRFDSRGKSINIGFDGEYKRVSREELGRDLPFYQNLDLLVFDAQYGIEELVNKHDWGHSTASIGIDLALRESIKHLVLIHHDPWATHEKLEESFARASSYLKRQYPFYRDAWPHKGQEGPILYSAYDGWAIDAHSL